jgi:hypothetical protein
MDRKIFALAVVLLVWPLVSEADDRPSANRLAVKPSEFNGTYAGRLNNSQVDSVHLKCEGGKACILTMSGSPPEVYQEITALDSRNYPEADSALKYAREHKAAAGAELVKGSPLAVLLESNAKISVCIDLRKLKQNGRPAEPPAYTILCKVDSDPWGKPAVLYMGTILANCGPVLCRFGFLPMFAVAAAKPRASGTPGYLGTWEYSKGQSLVRVAFESEGRCRISDTERGQAVEGRCRYSESGTTVSITHFANLQGDGSEQKLPEPLSFQYEADTDSMTWGGQEFTRTVEK